MQNINIGKSKKRVDAPEKASGGAMYYEDLIPDGVLYGKILHSKIAHGFVKTINVEQALKVPGVVKIFTCFDVPDHKFSTAGHPFSFDSEEVPDRKLLNRHVRYYGDDVALVVARDEISAYRALDKIQVEYEELPFYLDPEQAFGNDKAAIHSEHPDNLLDKKQGGFGDFEKCVSSHNCILAEKLPHDSAGNVIVDNLTDDDLVCVKGVYEVPAVQHCHIENWGCFVYCQNNQYIVVSSTQIPNILQRLISEALQIDHSSVRVVKPCIGGGFGNKQDMQYEALCVWACSQLANKPVRIDCSREETFRCNRTRYQMRFYFSSYLNKHGKIVAKKTKIYANKGAYASHGVGVVANSASGLIDMYDVENVAGEIYLVYTNCPVSGAMRGYGLPEAVFAGESHLDDCAKALGKSCYEIRQINAMKKGYENKYSHCTNWEDSFRDCMAAGIKKFNYYERLAKLAGQTGSVRRGVGFANFCYYTGVFPELLEISSCRLLLNLSGTVSLQTGDVEIGQGFNTVASQMAADAIGLNSSNDVSVVSFQDTNFSPVGLGAYASRQTYMFGFAIKKTSKIFRKRIVDRSYSLLKKHPEDFENILCDLEAVNTGDLDIIDGKIVYLVDSANKKNINSGLQTKSLQKKGEDIAFVDLMDLKYVAQHAMYDGDSTSTQLTAEATADIQSSNFTIGTTFCEVEVDIDTCKVKIIDLLNVHDSGKVINPGLAKAQVHGGVSMSAGYGLSEELKYDQKTGRQLNGNFLDYKIPTFMDMCDTQVEFVQNEDPESPFGVKGLGEPPACSPAAAIRNAVLNATGVSFNKLPLNAATLYEGFKKHGFYDETVATSDVDIIN